MLGNIISLSPPPTLNLLQPFTVVEICNLIFSFDNQCTLKTYSYLSSKTRCFHVLGPLSHPLSTSFLPKALSRQLFLWSHLFLLTEDLLHYCSISNLNFISKLLQQAVANCLNSHLSSHKLSPFQIFLIWIPSHGNCATHFHYHIISSMSKRKVNALILLDLFTPSGTVSYNILHHYLEHWFSLSCPAVNRFASFSTSPCQSIHLISTVLNCGFPQVSMLGFLISKFS